MGRHAGDNHRAVNGGCGAAVSARIPDNWLDMVLDEVCSCYGVSRELVLSPYASTGLGRSVRQIAMYVSRVAFDVSLDDIGCSFGISRQGAFHNVKVVSEMCERDDALAERLDGMCSALACRGRGRGRGRGRCRGRGRKLARRGAGK